jgi:hypothetical protein
MTSRGVQNREPNNTDLLEPVEKIDLTFWRTDVQVW